MLYKIVTYLFLPLSIILLYLCADNFTRYLSKKFYNWQQNPNFEFQRVFLTAFLTAIMTILIRGILNTDRMKTFAIQLYSFLCRQYLYSQKVAVCKIIESFINIIYKGEFLPLKEQSNIIEDILNDLSEISLGHNATHLFIISGDGHSGKTILAKKIINDIFTREEYIHLLKRYSKGIFYYDLATFNKQLEQILRDYEKNYYCNKIVVFDNIHKLNNSEIIKTITSIIRLPNNARCVLLLTRDINYILNDKLISEIEEKKANKILKTENLSVLRFDNEYQSSEGFTEFVNTLRMNDVLLNNDFIHFHLYYIYNIYLQNKNKTIIKLFNELNSYNFNNPLVKGLIFICCCTLFTGVIDIKIFKKWLERKNCYLYLNTYVEIGIINRFQGIRSSEYSIHEKTARAYISYAATQTAGLNLCRDYFLFLSQNTEGSLKYRYSIPFDLKPNPVSFDELINNGNFLILYEDLKYIIKIFNLNESEYSHEIGLLNDRIGSYKSTKYYILKQYKQTKDDANLIILLHADHMMYYDKNFHKKYVSLLSSGDLYLNFASNYWINHIEMHEGRWNIDTYLSLYKKLPQQLDNIANRSYETFHVLRRFYFDALRIYYLQGMCDFEYFKKILDKLEFIKVYLKNRLPEFETYAYKFVYGHYIHYDMLFNHYVLGISPSKNELDFLKCSDISNAINVAMGYYYKAYKTFKKNGDKTYDYVLLRMCELSPEYVLNHILNKPEKIDLVDFKSEDYQAIIDLFDDYRKRCGIDQNVLEYAAFAETFKLKFTFMCKLLCVNIGTDIDFDLIINNCANNACKYHDEYNPQHSNNYGKLRIRLLTTLNSYVNDHSSLKLQQKLDIIKKDCIDKKYNRELKIINCIESSNYVINKKLMNNIAKFYPIVLQ